MDAAFNLIWQGSFHASGVAEICAHAQVHKGSFYHFFKSKSDLAAAAVYSQWERMQQVVFTPAAEDGPHGLQRLRCLIDTIVEQAHACSDPDHGFPGCPFGNIGQEMACQDEQLQRIMRQIFSEHIDYFEQILAEAVARREIEPGNLRDRAQSIFAILQGGFLLAKVTNDLDCLTRAARAVYPAIQSDPDRTLHCPRQQT